MRLWWQRWGGLVTGIPLVALYYWAVAGLEWNLSWDSERAAKASGLVRAMFLETDWAYAPELGWRMVETVQIALLGTAVGAVLALPFGFLAARNVTRARPVVGLAKFLLNLIRAFPELILAILFTKAVGLGPFPGILAMGVHSVGMLGKLYAEVVEAMDRDVLEAMAAAGANRVQTIWYGVLPQVLPEFASYALYRLEINMRAAPILGMVGAGGIGHPLIFAIQAFDWSRVGVILYGIILMVAVVDLVSSRLRARLV